MKSSGSNGLGLMVVAMLVLAGSAGFMFYSDSKATDILPPSTSEYEVSGYIIDQSGTTIENLNVDGSQSIVVLARDGNTLVATLNIDYFANNGKYSTEFKEMDSFYWYFDLDMGDKDIDVVGMQKIQTINGEKECKVYDEYLENFGLRIRFFINTDDKIVYRTDAVTLTQLLDSDGNYFDIVNLYARSELSKIDQKTGPYNPAPGSGDVITKSSIGTYAYSSVTLTVDDDPKGETSIRLFSHVVDENNDYYAYSINSSLTGEYVTLELSSHLLVTSEGELIGGEFMRLVDGGAEWELVNESVLCVSGYVMMVTAHETVIINDLGKIVDYSYSNYRTYDIPGGDTVIVKEYQIFTE